MRKPSRHPEDFKETIFDCIEKHLLAGDIIEAALDRAVSALTTRGGQDPREHLERELSRVLRELENLTTAVAAGGALSVLLDAIRRREKERDGLAHQLAELNRESAGSRCSKPAVRTELRRRVADWRWLLREQGRRGAAAPPAAHRRTHRLRADRGPGVQATRDWNCRKSLAGNPSIESDSPGGTSEMHQVPLRS